MANDNERILARLRGVAAQPGTPETDADPRNPYQAAVRIETLEAVLGTLRDIEDDLREQASGEQDGYLLSIANQLRNVIEMAN